ncbi:hypothetical protein CDD83_6313 [Cordyceps sp. RAO-2017]|nr:hypothetical protein CDD83_6313 [Cordyceps sp. RAO-2017]
MMARRGGAAAGGRQERAAGRAETHKGTRAILRRLPWPRRCRRGPGLSTRAEDDTSVRLAGVREAVVVASRRAGQPRPDLKPSRRLSELRLAGVERQRNTAQRTAPAHSTNAPATARQPPIQAGRGANATAEQRRPTAGREPEEGGQRGKKRVLQGLRRHRATEAAAANEARRLAATAVHRDADEQQQQKSSLSPQPPPR